MFTAVIDPASCGFRTQGDAYVCTYGSSNGRPFHEFLLCLPWPVDKEGIGLADQGMKIIERIDLVSGKGIGVYDLWDVVGQSYWPYVPDFVMECYHFLSTSGRATSRKIPKTVLESDDYAKLDPVRSRHIFVHDKAIINNPEILYKSRADPAILDCPHPQINPTHLLPYEDLREMELFEPCIGLLWECVGETKTDSRTQYIEMPRQWKKWIPESQWGYNALYAKEEWGIEYSTGAFLALPITKIEVIRSEDDEHVDKIDAAQMGQFPVEEMEY